MTINWRERLIAAAIHFTVTLIVTALAATIIFFVWFPGAMAAMVGGTKLFLLITISDLVLGPLLSLVIYSSKKSRRELIVDYAVIGSVQLASLIYGMLVVADSRPVFVAFNQDRLHVVTAFELTELDLKGGTAVPFRSESWLGPRLISIAEPANEKEQAEVAGYTALGRGAHLMPKYYRPYDEAHAQILRASRAIQSLLDNSGAAKAEIESAIDATGKTSDQLRWLPVDHRFGSAVALVDAGNDQPLKYLALDPAWTAEQAKSPDAKPEG